MATSYMFYTIFWAFYRVFRGSLQIILYLCLYSGKAVVQLFFLVKVIRKERLYIYICTVLTGLWGHTGGGLCL